MSRCSPLMPVTAAVVALAACSPALEPAEPASPHAEAHARADEALHALLTRFWNGPAGFFDRATIIHGFPASYWNAAQAFDALLDGAERTHGAASTGLADTFFRAQDARGWSAGLYDDKNWMVMALVRAYDASGDEKDLRRAQAIFDDILAAWDTTCCGPRPGGVWWDVAHTSKATASNGGPTIAAARLYARTGDERYLSFARQVYAYWKAEMVDPVTFEVTDSINADGHRNRWKFTYNEGQLVGAALELHRVTGERAYLDDAHAFAGAILATETADAGVGRILSDGAPPDCAGEDCPLFKGIAFRYLANLEAVDPRPELTQVLEQSARGAYELARERDTGRFAVDWAGPADAGDGTLAQQVSATFAIDRWANLLGGPPAGGSEAFVREAEDAVLDRLTFVAPRAGFTGWAALWSPGLPVERLAFDFTLPDEGPRRLSLRYATRSTGARREAVLDGHTVGVFELPATDGGASALSALDPVLLGAGRHQLVLVMPDGGSGGAELDALLVEPAPACAEPAPEPFFLTAPAPGQSACGAPDLCWSRARGATHYRAIVDGQVVCEGSGRCCTPSSVSPGWHLAWVEAASACASRSTKPVSYLQAPPGAPLAAQVEAVDGGTRVTWTAAEARPFGADVRSGGVLQCVTALGGRCTFPGAPDQLEVTAHLGCRDSSRWR
ncbi:MAG: hypothetical protein K1X89_06965 [Myxococcaceae bacterium]|nr:hypothetical protein [Myxococcaceae bacterium]